MKFRKGKIQATPGCR